MKKYDLTLDIKDYFYYGNPFNQDDRKYREIKVTLTDSGAKFNSEEDEDLYKEAVHFYMDVMRFYDSNASKQVHEESINKLINPGMFFDDGIPIFFDENRYHEAVLNGKRFILAMDNNVILYHTNVENGIQSFLNASYCVFPEEVICSSCNRKIERKSSIIKC